MDAFDLVVIGAGPGGYVAAIRAAQLNKKVAVIEAHNFGGACLNVGCIPSKTFLKHSEWMLTLHEASRFGIENQVTRIDVSKLVQRKCNVVNTLRNGIKHLFAKNKITLINGTAQFNQQQELLANGKPVKANKILLATGSKPFVPPIKGLEQVDYDTTDEFFDLPVLPKELVIIGGGVIGVELAFSMAPLGVKTTIIEVAKDILLTEDIEARQLIKRELFKQGIQVIIGAEIASVEPQKVILSNQSVSFDRLLVATGRHANLALAQQIGLQLDERGKFVKVDQYYRTSHKDIYAIGDLIGAWMLAHAASEEGIVAVDHMFGHGNNTVNQNRVPRCVYSFPEIASVGLMEAEAKAQGLDIMVKKQPFGVNGKAISADETNGFVKLIATKPYREVVGAVVVGAHATEMIHTILSVMQAEGTIDDLASQVFAHPTLSEVIGETAKSVIFKAIHE